MTTRRRRKEVNNLVDTSDTVRRSRERRYSLLFAMKFTLKSRVFCRIASSCYCCAAVFSLFLSFGVSAPLKEEEPVKVVHRALRLHDTLSVN